MSDVSDSLEKITSCGGRGSDERCAGSCMAAPARIVLAMTAAIALRRS